MHRLALKHEYLVIWDQLCMCLLTCSVGWGLPQCIELQFWVIVLVMGHVAVVCHADRLSKTAVRRVLPVGACQPWPVILLA